MANPWKSVTAHKNPVRTVSDIADPSRRSVLIGGTAFSGLAAAATLLAGTRTPGISDYKHEAVNRNIKLPSDIEAEPAGPTTRAIAASIGGDGAELPALLAQIKRADVKAATDLVKRQRQVSGYLVYKAEMLAHAPAGHSPALNLLGLTAPAVASPNSMQSVDDLGSTDDARITALNALAKGQAASNVPRTGFMFSNRNYQITVPIELWSGLYLQSEHYPAREFSTGASIDYRGPAGTSTFKFVVNTQGYPSDGSPRDITIRGIQFQGGAATSVFPIIDPALPTSTYRGHVFWFLLLDGCGFKNQKCVLWGYGDGLVIDGVTHVQSIGDVVFKLGGSECSVFPSGVQCAGGNSVDNGKPFIQLLLSKSAVGMCMTTMRKTSYSMEILGGFDLTIINWRADNQDGDPGYGTGIVVRDGEGIFFRDVSVKGYGIKPSAAIGGAAANMAMISVLGGTGIDFGRLLVQLDASGRTSAGPTFPALFVGPNVGQGQVSVELARTTRANGVPPILLQSRAGQIVGASRGAVVRTI